MNKNDIKDFNIYVHTCIGSQYVRDQWERIKKYIIGIESVDYLDAYKTELQVFLGKTPRKQSRKAR